MSRSVALLVVVFLLATCWQPSSSIPGGWSEAQADEEDVQVAASHAARVLSERFNSKYHHALKEVLKAQRQVVAGMNYRLDLVLGMTNCKKGDVAFEEVENCDFQDSKNTYKECAVVVYRNLSGYHRMGQSACSLVAKGDDL